jgi:hypothetical protein
MRLALVSSWSDDGPRRLRFIVKSLGGHTTVRRKDLKTYSIRILRLVTSWLKKLARGAPIRSRMMAASH